MAFVARAIAWAAAAAGLLAGGLLAVGWVLIAITGPGYAKLGDMQQIAFQSLYSAILLQALLPQAASAFVGWLGVTALVPALDAGWKRLAPGVAIVAALCFPIAARRFAIWQPTSTQDVVSTFLLLSGSVALALLLPRLLPKLGPGVFWSKIPSDS
ncbi:MAG TPA: hypothetical protein VNE71_12835 [Myxococcota bacterium]|nr:hypothetical protein [Myxococcota bacterium]